MNNNYLEGSTQKAGKWHSLYNLRIKEAMALTLFCLHALLRKAPETIHPKIRQMIFALFLCGRFRHALRNNTCIKVSLMCKSNILVTCLLFVWSLPFNKNAFLQNS